MKVKELTDRLSVLDPEAVVVRDDVEYGYQTVAEVYQLTSNEKTHDDDFPPGVDRVVVVA